MKRDYTKLKCIILSILVGLLLLAAVFADHIVPYDPYAQDLEHALLPPGVRTCWEQTGMEETCFPE